MSVDRVQFLFAKALRVEPGEWKKVAQFSLLGLMLQAGLGIGFSAGDAMFLSHVGAASLPIIFLLTPVVMLVYTPVFAWLVSRFSMHQVLCLMIALLAVGAMSLFFANAVVTTDGPLLYYAIKLYLAALYISIYSVFWLFVDNHFTVQDAKRLFPLFAAGCSVGLAIGAFVVGALAGLMPLSGFFLLWSVVAALTLPVAMIIHSNWREISDQEIAREEDAAPLGFVAQQRHVLRALLTSRFSMLLAATLLTTLFLTNFAEFQYSTILAKGRSEAELATLLGRLYGTCHVFNIFVCLFVFNPLIRRLGVKNVALVLPVVYLSSFILLFISSGILAASVVFWAFHGVLTSIEYNNQNLLFNAVPAQNRKEVRALLEGLCEPSASCISGAILLLVDASWGLRQVAGLALIVAALLVAIVLGLRNAYPRAMSINMRRGWIDFGSDPIGSTHSADPGAIALLVRHAGGPASRTAGEALYLLGRIVPAAAAGPALQALRSWPTPEQGALKRTVRELLATLDETDFAGFFTGLQDLSASGNAIAISELSQHGSDAAEKDRRPSIEQLVAEIEGGEGAARSHALARLADLADANDFVLLAPVIRCLPQLEGEDRERALRLVELTIEGEALDACLALAPGFSPAERRQLQRIIVRKGEYFLPGLIVAVQDPALLHCSRSVAARALGQISVPQLEAISEAVIALEIDRLDLQQAQAELFAAAGARTAFLAERCLEQVQEGLDFVLEMLALGGALPDFDMIVASLDSTNEKIRGNALETIETSVGQPIFDRLKPIIASRGRKHLTDSGGDVADKALVDLLETVMADPDEIAAAAAAEALCAIAPDRLCSLAQSRLADGGHPLIAEVIDRHLGLGTADTLVRARNLRLLRGLQGARLGSLLAVVRSAEGGSTRSLRQRAGQLAGRYPDLAQSLLATRSLLASPSLPLDA